MNGHEGDGLTPPTRDLPSNMNIQHPKLLALHEHWQAKLRVGEFPHRSDFDPFDLKPFLGHILILELAEELDESHYRLFGSKLSEYFDADLTGMRLKDIPADRPDMILLEYQNMLLAKAPLVACNQALVGSSVAYYEKLMLPLASGERPIAMVLGAIYPVDNPDQ